MDEIEKMKEWQDNQYNLGHWTGGNIPGWVFNKKAKIIAWIAFTSFVLILLIYVL